MFVDAEQGLGSRASNQNRVERVHGAIFYPRKTEKAQIAPPMKNEK